MTTRILIDNIRDRFNHTESKLYLKEKYTNQLTVAFGGGMWTITPQLIAFLRQSSNSSPYEILVDNYNNPHKIDREEFLALAITTYNKIMNQWYDEHTELQAKR
jgi:hypothetical protein